MNQKEQLHSIQQISTKLNIPKPTLRFWEKEFEGILLPLRTNGGQRRYTSEHVSIIGEIKVLKKAGLCLAEIKTKLKNRVNGDNSNREGIDLLAERVAEAVRSEVVRFFERGEGSKKP
jgi:DNA-binding transcriptional MerR regulator